MTSDNPFADIDSTRPGSSAGRQSPGASGKTIATAIGAALVLAGFVWKFFAGSAPAGDEAAVVDFLWLAPVAIGAVVLAAGFRKRR